jgi:hypothetical protein
VSLEGTLETIALPDVLALLSVTAKTGELRIEAGGGVGSVWFDAGQLAGFDVGSHKTPVDALFALLRLREGNFKFHTGTEVVNALPPEDVAPVLDEAESRLMQWPAIAAAIPSLYCELNLNESVDGTVMLRPDQWQLVAAIAGGRQVVDVLNQRGLGEFDGCRAIKDLVDLRLVKVSGADAPPAAQAALTARPANTPDLSEGAADTVQWHAAPAEEDHEEAHEATEVADLSDVWKDEGGGAEAEEPAAPGEPAPEPVNRGLLLKFLGSARN